MTDRSRDVVAIFHCSFHPTRGNVVDWSLKASDDIDLSNVEFSCLPSGLHTVEEDVVYFLQDEHPGVCIFRRRQTEEHGHRGFRLSSLGVLLAPSSAPHTSLPRPWLHVRSLRSLVHALYSRMDGRAILEPTDSDWDPVRTWFEQYHLSPEEYVPLPALNVPLTSLGPSLLTISRFLLARRRVLILAKPPVEGACVLCWVIGELCSGVHRTREKPHILGMVTLHDFDRLQLSESGPGWIACTTDSVLVEKTRCWDLLVDLTSCDLSALCSLPSLSTTEVGGGGRPRLYVPKGSLDGDSEERRNGKKEAVRFAWSDVKLWTDLSRFAPSISSSTYFTSRVPLQSRTPAYRPPPGPSSSLTAPSWLDVGRIYEDACILCASVWYASSSDEARIRLDGSDTLSSTPVYEGTQGMSLESTHQRSVSGTSREPLQTTKRALKRMSGGSNTVWTNWTGRGRQDRDEDEEEDAENSEEDREQTVSRVFQGYHARLLERLDSIIVEQTTGTEHSQHQPTREEVVVLAPKDLAALDLSPLSGMDARWVEWLAELRTPAIPITSAGAPRVTVKVRKARWRDVLGVVFGFG
ncbi:hypothetical protein BDW22DRAFT_1483434 [Trametopsis cervina]|nr:hypothetical protein BDW22DRAFT_1483434 [Trametopsis cervina]